ncbi:hypothetical protein HK100_001963 [Physocladia obscura]|uniref:F-box domain-containing protein n=1 Tax=Physocladia obscura TaxID=109957 RepID=A0AAD5SXP5_9FUNG|nr:hypothetical protein HK100_001963 [Physocladia obscura]
MQLPPELWQRLIDCGLNIPDLLALRLTSKFFFSLILHRHRKRPLGLTITDLDRSLAFLDSFSLSSPLPRLTSVLDTLLIDLDFAQFEALILGTGHLQTLCSISIYVTEFDEPPSDWEPPDSADDGTALSPLPNVKIAWIKAKARVRQLDAIVDVFTQLTPGLETVHLELQEYSSNQFCVSQNMIDSLATNCTFLNALCCFYGFESSLDALSRSRLRAPPPSNMILNLSVLESVSSLAIDVSQRVIEEGLMFVSDTDDTWFARLDALRVDVYKEEEQNGVCRKNSANFNDAVSPFLDVAPNLTILSLGTFDLGLPGHMELGTTVFERCPHLRLLQVADRESAIFGEASSNSFVGRNNSQSANCWGDDESANWLISVLGNRGENIPEPLEVLEILEDGTAREDVIFAAKNSKILLKSDITLPWKLPSTWLVL